MSISSDQSARERQAFQVACEQVALVMDDQLL